MELDLQGLFGSCAKLYSLAETPQPSLSPPLGSYTRALLVSQYKRHLFVIPWYKWKDFGDCSIVKEGEVGPFLTVTRVNVQAAVSSGSVPSYVSIFLYNSFIITNRGVCYQLQ